MKTTVRVDGLRELDRALAELPKATGKAVLRRVLKKAGQPIADDMRAKAPDDPSTTGAEDLGDSVAVSTKLSRRQAKLHRKMFKDEKASAEMFVGPGPLPQAIQQEWGNVNHGPQPFARPAWDANKMRALDIIKADLGDEIMKSAKRLAKKRAKG